MTNFAENQTMKVILLRKNNQATTGGDEEFSIVKNNSQAHVINKNKFLMRNENSLSPITYNLE
jgi:hypothetical protein